MDLFDIVDDNYGVEEEGLVPEADEEKGVEIPYNTIELSEQQIHEVKAAVDPTADSEDYGITMYTDTKHFLDSL